MLEVNSSIVYVSLGPNMCDWGSVYLDAYGEEDLELRYDCSPLIFSYLTTNLLTKIETDKILSQFYSSCNCPHLMAFEMNL